MIASDAADVVTPPTDNAAGDVVQPSDAASDVPATPMDGGASTLAMVRDAIAGGGTVTLNAALSDLVVTRVVAATPGADGGVSANDPAGFFVQAGMTGPAAFVAVDPSTLTPAPQQGDRVSFTATQGRVAAGAKWIVGVSGYTRSATGVALAGLTQDLSGAADIATGIGDYESELVRVQGAAAGSFTSAGTGFESAQITTMGVPAAMNNLRLRVESGLRMSLGLRMGCTFTVTAPLWRFNAQTQVHAWTMGDISGVNCPPVMDAGTPADGGGGTDGGGATDVPVVTPVDVPAVDAGSEATPTEVWVLRVGDGSGSLSNASTAVFIDRVRIADGMQAGPSIALPIAASGMNRPLTLSGSATSEGQLTRSTDRRFVVLGGYNVAPGTASVASSMVPRVVGRISAAGAIDTSTLLGDGFLGGNIRGAASVDGSEFWAAGQSSGAGGIVTARLGAMTSMAIITAPTNVRAVDLYDRAIYGAVSSSGGYGVMRVDGTTGTLLPGFPTASGPSRYGFVAFDRDSTPGIDTIYQCDDGSATSMTGRGGVWKYTLTGGTWTESGPYRAGFTNGCRSITGFASGGSVTLLTVNNANHIMRGVDSGAGPDMTMFMRIRDAAANTALRGITLAPR